MKVEISKVVKGATTLPQVQKAVLSLFEEMKKNGSGKRIGYVAGMIFSEGPEHVEKNIKALSDYTVAYTQHI